MKKTNDSVRWLVGAVMALSITISFAATEREYIWPDGKMPNAQARRPPRRRRRGSRLTTIAVPISIGSIRPPAKRSPTYA